MAFGESGSARRVEATSVVSYGEKQIVAVGAARDPELFRVAMADGVDYIVLPTWKVFMIQFLNIAGTGPIFGAIMGAWYGPKAYLWIVLGCIFAGAMHDFFSGMLSIRNKGANLPEIIGLYLGKSAKAVMLVFSVFLLMMVGVVFVYSPALLLQNLVPSVGLLVWVVLIFLYYVLATMLPIAEGSIPSSPSRCFSWRLPLCCS